ncbi:MAG: transketolase family protein [Synergistetes bacterium]|nr:transketolase family protein [Synergistota bacterium]MCX8127365.1 transketolase family protein [Synergistota bacterium]MDW8192229.1 transketolase family protein [Synergistota bacterium]
MVTKRSPREAYAKALIKLGEERDDIVVFDADLSTSTQTAKFGARFPRRFFNMGVAEANMMATAAGMAISGKTVFASTFAVFATSRAYDQVRVAIAYSSANVKIVATHGGITVGEDGASHHAIEDLALMRVMPNMRVLAPSDYQSTYSLILKVAEEKGPFYVRLTRVSLPDIYSEGEVFNLGGGKLLREGRDVTIVAEGPVVFEALSAAEMLASEGISAEVIDSYSIKPLPEELILDSLSKTKRVVTVEDHSIIGGLGGAIAELISEKLPCPLKRLGVRDTFCCSGSAAELLKHVGLDAEGITREVKKFLDKF